MASRRGCSARRQFRRCADAGRRRRLQRLHRGAALQARHPLAEPDDRADRRGVRGHRCPSSPPSSRTAPASARRRGWAIIAYTAIFPSILSQIFYIRGVEMIGANRAGLFINLVPIFGTLLSILILGEDFRSSTTRSPWRWRWAASGWPRAQRDGKIGACASRACRRTVKRLVESACDASVDDALESLVNMAAAHSHLPTIELQPLGRIDRFVGARPFPGPVPGNGASR